MRWLLFVMVSGCSGAGGVDCETLDADACAAESACQVIEGTPTVLQSEDPTDPNSPSCWVPAGDPEAVGCQPVDSACPPEEVFAAPPDADIDPWSFPTGCYPLEWEKGDFLPACEM